MTTVANLVPFTNVGDASAHYWGAGGGFGPFTGLLLIAVVAAIVWFAARGELPWQRSPVDRAREILLERYARGEISHEEYRQQADNLR